MNWNNPFSKKSILPVYYPNFFGTKPEFGRSPFQRSCSIYKCPLQKDICPRLVPDTITVKVVPLPG